MNLHPEFALTLAQAQQPAGQPPGIGGLLIMLVPMMIIWYILLIKPQRKKQQQHDELVKTLKAGDRVVTLGGIHGEVAGVEENVLTLKIAEKVKIKVNRASVAEKVVDTADAADKK